MRNLTAPLGILLALCLLVPTAAAHERYFSSDDRFLIVLGEQNEPVYTYDFTNLDLQVRDNVTGDPISGVEETLAAALIAPDGSELSLPLAVQHGQEGRYKFVEEYQLTMPGQYKVRLTGHIDGTDVGGTYLLPGPRSDFRDITFPHDDVPTCANSNSASTPWRPRSPPSRRRTTTASRPPATTAPPAPAP